MLNDFIIFFVHYAARARVTCTVIIEKKIILSPTGFEPAISRFVVSRLTDCTIASDKRMSLRSVRARVSLRRPGIEPGPRAWKARILTIELSTHHMI